MSLSAKPSFVYKTNAIDESKGERMSSSHKYSVPALERAQQVLSLIAEAPSAYKLIDLSRMLEIHKSTMYSLLLTMERMGWVEKDAGDSYRLGDFFGRMGNRYFRQYDLVSHFHRHGASVRTRMAETLQLGKLTGGDVFYLAKLEAPSAVRLVSEPGLTWKAYVTGLGKVMLADKSDAEVIALYPDEQLERFTDKTIASRSELLTELARVREQGYAIEEEEAVQGFNCTAAPIRGAGGVVVAAVSFSIPQYHWEEKKAAAIQEIVELARVLSHV